MDEFSAWLQAQGVDPLTGGIVLGFVGGWLFARMLRRDDHPPPTRATSRASGESIAPSTDPLALSSLRSALRNQGSDAELAGEQAQQVLALLQARQKLEAIKLLRSLTGLGLKETKDACDEVERDQRWGV